MKTGYLWAISYRCFSDSFQFYRYKRKLPTLLKIRRVGALGLLEQHFLQKEAGCSKLKIQERGAARILVDTKINHNTISQWSPHASSSAASGLSQFTVKLCRRLSKVFPFRQQEIEYISFSKMLSFFYR